MTSYIRLLRRNPQFARLWFAQAISLLGDWFSLIALSSLVARYSGGSGWAVSGLLLSQLLPTVLVGPFAGVLVDRLDRRKLLIFSDVARTLITLLFLLATGPDRLWLIYVLTLSQFSLSALFEPGRSALLPSLVAADDLVQANVLGNVTWSAMLAVGGLIGGSVAAVLGPEIALAINAFSFVISALLIGSIRRTAELPTAPGDTAAPDTVPERGFIDGLRYIRRHPATAATLLIKAGSVGSVDAMMIIYATQLFVLGENGAGSLGLLYAAFGVGAVLGPVLLNRFNDNTSRRMRRLIAVGYGSCTIGWFALGGAPTLLLAALAIVVRAMGGSVGWTYSSVILQQTVPDRFLGRLFAIDLAAVQLSSMISVLVTGWVVEQLGAASVRTVVFGTGFVSIVPLLLWVLALPWIERQPVPLAEEVPVGTTG